MKIAIIADSHFDERSRFDECIRMHDFIAKDAARRGCTKWLHSGDVFHRKSTADERKAAIEWTLQMSILVGDGVIVRGNHDAPLDLWPLGRLETAAVVEVVESARVVEFSNLVVQCIPWPTRASLLGESLAESEQEIGEALRDVLRGLSRERDGRPRVLLSHAMVRGSRTATGQPLVGCDCEIGAEDFALCDSDFYALGHVHMGQGWTVGGKPVVYPGSPYRTTFGETEVKGYVVVEFNEEGRLVAWERVPTPCAKMLLLEAEWHPVSEDCTVPGLFIGAVGFNPAGAEVRLRYTVTEAHREAAKAAAIAERTLLLETGAASVKLEEVVNVETRARAPEVATATSLSAKLTAHWDSQGTAAPGESDRPRLLTRLHELQAEVGL